MRWDLLQRLLRCPRCRRRPLSADAERLHCPDGHVFGLVRGVPVLTPQEHQPRVWPEDHRSNELPEWLLRWLDAFPGPTLHLGAGSTPRALPRCVEVELAVFRHTDVVADAHELPFVDGGFDAVLTLNTFEHLHEPQRAADELARVLKPGGQLFLQTAFLQPLHEPPHHYFNMTEHGVRALFRRWQIDAVTVPGNKHPLLALGWQATELLHQTAESLGRDAEALLSTTTVAELRAVWASPDARRGALWERLQALPGPAQAALAAGFELHARTAATPPSGERDDHRDAGQQAGAHEEPPQPS